MWAVTFEFRCPKQGATTTTKIQHETNRVIQPRSFYTVKKTINLVKTTNREKILASYLPGKRLV